MGTSLKITQQKYEESLSTWQKARFSPAPEKPLNPTKPSQEEMVAMRDGVKLYTELFLPALSKPVPVILIRSPYRLGLPSRNDLRPISRYHDAGYAVVYQLTRGQGRSQGHFRFLRDDIDDGYDTIEWLTGQAWCNGKVGMEGPSYLGSTQLLAAKSKHPALKCIAPTAFVSNFTRSFPFSCGVPSKGPYMQWHQVLDVESWDEMDVNYCDMRALDHPKWGSAFRKKPLADAADNILNGDKLSSWRETIANPTDNEFWEAIHFTDRELAELDLPIFITDGWYDMTIGPVDLFSQFERIKPGRSNLFLLIGPWDHYQTFSPSQPGEDNGDRIMPENGEINHVDHRLEFFDHYLKGKKESIIQPNRVRVYITGAQVSNANRWFDLPTFPAPGTNYRKLYLHSRGDARSFPGDGQLSWQVPEDEPADNYVYDPATPTDSIVESFRDRRHVEIRSDVLTYTSTPFTEALTILGDIEFRLYAASDALDTDWFVVVSEVYPNGQSKSFHYAPPGFRARYRKGLDIEILLTPDKPEVFAMSLGPAGHQISAGNRLRLSIFSAAFPEYEPNSNTGNPAATDTEQRAAKQTVFHDAERSSHLILPIFEL